MIKIHSLSAQKLFLFVGIIFSLLFFTVSAQAQITASGCGTATVSPYAGTSSIFQIDANFEATYYCGEGFGIYENGSLLNCNNSLANTSSLSCQGHTGTFAYANGGTAESRTFYLDTRKQPYVFSDVPPTDNSLDIIQSPQNLVAPGASVTFTAAPVMLDGSAAPTVFTWFRNGAEIGGETGATLSEIPPHNGTTYSVQAGTLQSAEKTVLFTTAADGRFTTSGATATIVALDGCNSIYKLDGELGSDYNTTFQILENGTPLTNADLDVSSGGLGLSWNGTNIVSNSHGTNRKFSWYLNTRNGKPYQLLSTMPTRAFVSIALQGSSTIPKGNAVDFTSNVCPETGKTITGYQWIKNENGTESNLGVGATLTDTPTKNGTIYYLRVTFSDGTTKDSERIKILFAESFDGRFSMSNATATIFALDDCNSIYELHVTLGREHHSEFQILENGTPLTSADINVAGVGLTINGTTITSSSHGTNLQFTWYINTRNGKPYELLSTEPFNDPTWLSVKLSADKNIINAAGEAVQLTVEVCPPDDGTYTYEWYENGVLMHGKSGDAITVNPTKNGTDYTVVVNGTSSNEEIILFADACDNRLTIQEWYQTTIISDACAIDECHAVYRLTLNMKNDAHFAILLDGAAIDAQI
ncbi:MAG: hypothetical protein LBM68_05635, partial [Bacteroidales bacterium]|nr:hypothetical protein [Bacteroidales bacterium]